MGTSATFGASGGNGVGVASVGRAPLDASSAPGVADTATTAPGALLGDLGAAAMPLNPA